jgi:hypothetical protein
MDFSERYKVLKSDIVIFLVSKESNGDFPFNVFKAPFIRPISESSKFSKILRFLNSFTRWKASVPDN